MRVWCMGLLVVATSMGCRTGEDERTLAEQRQPTTETQREPAAAPIDKQQSPQAQEQPSAAATAAPEVQTELPRDAPGVMLGSAIVCRPTAALEESVERTIRFVDLNGDSRLSRQEAVSAMDLLVGGFFFRADENADGTVTREEAARTRSDLYAQYPSLAGLFAMIRDATGRSPFAAVAKMMAVEADAPLSIADARETARRSVTQAFAAIDADRNGEIGVEEVRAAADQGARAAGRASFEAADSNKDGALTREEVQPVVERATDMAFTAADGNGDGRLSREEAARGIGQLSTHLSLHHVPSER